MSNPFASGGIVILTGAGISAESGLGTFRDENGIWTKYPLEDLATRTNLQRDGPAARPTVMGRHEIRR